MNYARFQCQDLFEVLVARKILSKTNMQFTREVQTVEMDLADFFQKYVNKERLEDELKNVEYEIFGTVSEQISEFPIDYTGQKIVPETKKTSAFDYYNKIIETNLNWLKQGDNDWLKPCIKNYTIQNGLLHGYVIEFVLDEVIDSIKFWITSYVGLKSQVQAIFKSGIEGDAPAFEKQAYLFIARVKELQSLLGSETINIGMTDWGMRLSLFVYEKGTIPHPLNMEHRGKSLVPLYLEMNGIIDIIDFSFVNSPLDPSNANIQFTIRKPCINNIFECDNEYIPISIKKTLSESQIVILERVLDSCSDNLIFAGKQNLKKSIIDLSIWLIKKTVLCLEEKSYLKDKAIIYVEKNKDNDYIQVEDGFFLPFIYEKLVDEFGGRRIIVKPKKFGGEIDILFDNTIPIELKVWKKNEHRILEKTIEDKFPSAGQAAAYASLDRIVFLIILDISNPNKAITNIENCWNVITKRFDINESYPTIVISTIFFCNYPKPSENV